MNKKQAVEEVYQKGKLLSFENPEYFRQVGDFISTALREDVGEGDVTTQTVIPADLEMRAVINSKEKGVFCGQQELKFLYKSQNVRLKFLVDDGQEIACEPLSSNSKTKCQTAQILTTQSFGYQKSPLLDLDIWLIQHRRMKLHELHIRDSGASSISHSNAVTRCHHIARVFKNFARTPSCQNGFFRPDCPHFVRGNIQHIQICARQKIILRDEIDRHMVVQTGDIFRLTDLAQKRLHDVSPRVIVHAIDALAAVSALLMQNKITAFLAAKIDSQIQQRLYRRVVKSLDAFGHDLFVTQSVARFAGILNMRLIIVQLQRNARRVNRRNAALSVVRVVFFKAVF